MKSGEQHKKFLADKVDSFQKVVLKQGWTFMLPSGWIHAVYTPKDSIVFGGNFVHCLNMQTQLDVFQIENRTKVPLQFRFPVRIVNFETKINFGSTSELPSLSFS